MWLKLGLAPASDEFLSQCEDKWAVVQHRQRISSQICHARLFASCRAVKAVSNTGKLFPNKSQYEMFYPHKIGKGKCWHNLLGSLQIRQWVGACTLRLLLGKSRCQAEKKGCSEIVKVSSWAAGFSAEQFHTSTPKPSLLPFSHPNFGLLDQISPGIWVTGDLASVKFIYFFFHPILLHWKSTHQGTRSVYDQLWEISQDLSTRPTSLEVSR